MPISSRYSSIQSARYPLSPAMATGHAIGSPSPSTTRSSAPSSRGTKAVVSCACPARQMEVQGVAMAVAEEVDLRREAPAGTPQGVIRGLLGVFLFRAPGGTSGGADHGAVDAPQLVVDLTGVDPRGPQPGEDRVQRPVVVPGVEEVPDGGPGAELLGQVAPGRPGPEDPEDAVDDRSPISPRASRGSRGREEVMDRVPIVGR